jgi:hypothetical protein
MEFFKRKLDGYSTTMNPLLNYMEQAVNFVMVYKHLNRPSAIKLVKGLVSKANAKDPLVTFRHREENGDREMKSLKLSKYLGTVVKEGNIIVPSFTVYDHPSKNQSIQADFLKVNIKRRSEHKKKAFAAYQKKNMAEYIHNDVLQKVMKIFNNSLSGAYASKSTTLYSPAQHYTLTTITRSVASIGNAVSESVVGGNKCFYSPESVMNYITAIITNVNMNAVATTIAQFKLTIPTVQNVIDMLHYSSDRYWSSVTANKDIIEYVNSLDKYQRAAVMYVNDLYHMRMYNDSLLRELLSKLSKRMVNGSNNPLKDLSIDLEGVNNLVHHICMEDIKGLEINYKKLSESNPDLLMVLGSTAHNIYNTLNSYRLLIKTFLVTDVLPIDIGNIKDCYRDVIVLSDTDSTCGSYDDWINWYFGNTRFTPESVALSASVMTINTQVIDHNIRIFAKNMNIDNSLIGVLKMKNEFFWSTFITSNNSKHYYANTWIQEGNVFDKPKLEIKGVHLIAGANGARDVVEEAHKDMSRFLKIAEEGGKISAKELLTKVANMERTLLKEINLGNVNVLKLDKIKPAETYKDENKTKTPYFHYMIWDQVFSKDYGISGEPTYMVVKVPTTLKSKRLFNLYIETLDNEYIKANLSRMLSENGKDTLGTFRVPLTIAAEHGMPKEILAAADSHRIVLDNMQIIYLILETLGIYRKPKMLFCEMGY